VDDLILKNYRERAVAELSTFFARRPNSRKLPDQQSRSTFREAVAGWETSISVLGNPITVRVVVDQRFPFTRPRIFLVDKRFFREIPHVDANGLVCVLPDSATSSASRVCELTEVLLEEAVALLEAGLQQSNHGDFADEFLSYWSETVAPGQSQFWSLLNPAGPSRTIAATKTNGYTLFTDTPLQAASWLHNIHLGSQYTARSSISSLLLWLPTPLFPKDYPKSNRGVLELARAISAENLLLDVIPKESKQLPVIIGFDTSNGPVFGGILLNPPTSKQLLKGFRPGHLSRKVAIGRYLAANKVHHVDVRRADPSWLHFRGGDDLSKDLGGKKVAIVGCGSLGAEIAYLLAKAGVGGFVLVDHDLLSWDNVGRHLLGANSVGEYKASALQRFLLTQLPHLDVTAYPGKRWETVFQESAATITSADVVISTTGDWGSEAALNLTARSTLRFPPTIFGWIEPFGCAGHALLVSDIGGCLGCGMDELGRFSKTVCVWPSGLTTLGRAPGCGDFFQTYGPIQILPIQGMIAELALDVLLGITTRSELRTRIGSLKNLTDRKGVWNSEWSQQYGNPGEGGRQVTLPWPLDLTCTLCR
jgi:sulfur-carrier protein adenylyltransferase/sulfurtransferase